MRSTSSKKQRRSKKQRSIPLHRELVVDIILFSLIILIFYGVATGEMAVEKAIAFLTGILTGTSLKFLFRR